MTTNKTVQPRPHQIDALTSLTAALAVHDRAQLTMACGTGKTLVGRWHAQASDAEQVLVLLPSLTLVAQTLREWRRATGNFATGWRFRALVVCSDPTTAAGLAERQADLDPEDQMEITGATWDQVSARVTTDPTVASRFLKGHTPGQPQVVFSTYHSSPVVSEAQRRLAEHAFDLVICDEAHRLAGRPSDAFAAVLDNRAIAARKRLFMTATPKAFTAHNADADKFSMDDPRLFGPVAHTVSFGDAIEAGLLTDYRVVVVAGKADAVAQDATVPGALVRAIDEHGLTKVLSYHGRVAKAAAFANELDGHVTAGGRTVTARHVSGAMPTSRRVDTLGWLGEVSDEVRIVTNARCLSEGIDVPSVDGILFADTRNSVVDIIQSVGRVLRPAPGKNIGTIVLPVTLEDDGDDDTALALSSYSAVWTVLRGLRAHDQRLADEIDRVMVDWAREGRPSTRTGGFRIPRIAFVIPAGADLDALQLRTVQEVGSLWDRNYGLLLAWSDAHPGKVIPYGAKGPDGTVALGAWAEQQRLMHRRGLLTAERVRRLEQVPDWSWDREESHWFKAYDVAKTQAGEHGTILDNETGESRFASVYVQVMHRRQLGVWLAEQRQAFRLGVLNENRVQALEALPDWSWDGGLPAVDVAMVEALRVFVEFEKHAKVPDDHVEDGLRLGAWCWAVRRRELVGRLAPALRDEIAAATPAKELSARRFQWEKVETQWRLGYAALRSYIDREGSATPVGSHRERLPDVEHHLGQWCALQRLKYRRGELDGRFAELLEELPGWRWEVPLQRVDAQEPVDLPPRSKHGTPGAYSNHKCRCSECLEWRRQSDVERLARKRELRDPVPAARAQRHVERLEADFMANEKDTSSRNGRTLIAAVSGVSIGVIRKVMKGEATEIEREYETRLLTTTAAMCNSHLTTTGSRGRTTSLLTQRVDSGPTFELIDDLAARGFGISWISRELEYAGGLQLRRGGKVVGHIAQRVKDLHERTGDLVMPRLAASVRKPSLAELLAERDIEREAS